MATPANRCTHQDPELDIVANALARVSRRGVDAWRTVLVAASTDPTFQATNILISLPPGAAGALMMLLRNEAPHALSWLMAGCRVYCAKDQVQRNRVR